MTRIYCIKGQQGGGGEESVLLTADGDFTHAMFWSARNIAITTILVEYPELVQELDMHGNILREGGVSCGYVPNYGHGPTEVIWGGKGSCSSL